MNDYKVVINVIKKRVIKNVSLDNPNYINLQPLNQQFITPDDECSSFICGTGVIENEKRMVVFCGYGYENYDGLIQVARSNISYIEETDIDDERMLDAGNIAAYVYMVSKLSLYAGEKVIVVSDDASEKSIISELIEWMGGVPAGDLRNDGALYDSAIICGFNVPTDVLQSTLVRLKNNSIVVYNNLESITEVKREGSFIRCASTGAGFYDRDYAVDGKPIPEAYVQHTTGRNLMTAYEFIKSKENSHCIADKKIDTDSAVGDEFEYFEIIKSAYSEHIDSSMINISFAKGKGLSEESIVKSLAAILMASEKTRCAMNNSVVKVTHFSFDDGSTAILNEFSDEKSKFKMTMFFDGTTLVCTADNVKKYDSNGIKTIWSRK